MLDRNAYFIREQVGLLKTKGVYDILDPDTKAPLGQAKETTPGWVRAMRVFAKKQMLPMKIEVRDTPGEQLQFSIGRGWTFFRSKVSVYDAQGTSLGYFKSKLFSLGGGFHVFGADDAKVADVKGNWKGWDFKFLSASGQELGTVSKKFAGLGKELFTSADNYLIALTPAGAAQANTNTLLLAAGLAIDTVYKEK